MYTAVVIFGLKKVRMIGTGRSNKLLLGGLHHPQGLVLNVIPLGRSHSLLLWGWVGTAKLLKDEPTAVPDLLNYLELPAKPEERGDSLLTCFFLSLKICCSTLAISLSTRSMLWISSSFESLDGDASCSSPRVCRPPGDEASTFKLNWVS